LVGVAVEDEQRMVHVRAVVAMVGGSFLLPIGRIVGAVEVQEDAAGRFVLPACRQVEVEQRVREAPTGVPIPRILPARQRGLAGRRHPVSGRRPQTSLSKGS
jgi:hypothetical protein